MNVPQRLQFHLLGHVVHFSWAVGRHLMWSAQYCHFHRSHATYARLGALCGKSAGADGQTRSTFDQTKRCIKCRCGDALMQKLAIRIHWAQNKLILF